MSNKKHKKRRVKGRARDSRVPSTRARVGQPPLAPSILPRQAIAAKPGKTAVEEKLRRHIGPDLRRSLLSAAIVLLVLAILYLVLR